MATKYDFVGMQVAWLAGDAGPWYAGRISRDMEDGTVLVIVSGYSSGHESRVAFSKLTFVGDCTPEEVRSELHLNDAAMRPRAVPAYRAAYCEWAKARMALGAPIASAARFRQKVEAIASNLPGHRGPWTWVAAATLEAAQVANQADAMLHFPEVFS